MRKFSLIFTLFCLAAVFNQAYATWGAFDLDAFDIKVWKGSGSDVWVYDTSVSNDEGRWVGCDYGSTTSTSLGTVTDLYIKRFNLNTYKNGSSDVTGVTFNYRVYATGQTSNIPSFTSVSATSVSSTVTSGNNTNQEWYNSTLDVHVANGLTSGNYTLEFYFAISGNPSDQENTMDGNQDGTAYVSAYGANYKITFTYSSTAAPTISPTTGTLNFGNVPYGETKTMQLPFTYTGTEDLTKATVYSGATTTPYISIAGSASWFFTTAPYITKGTGASDYIFNVTYVPDQNIINNATGPQTLVIGTDAGTLSVSNSATSYSPLIVPSEEPVSAQSTATLEGKILYTGCKSIVEYGVYYSTDPTFFDKTNETVDLNNCLNSSVNAIITSGPYPADANTFLKIDLDGLTGNTTYYYVWYMKDESGEYIYQARLMNFTTTVGGYRILVTPSSGEPQEVNIIYNGTLGDTAIGGTAEYLMPCEPGGTWQLQYYYIDDTQNISKWRDVIDQEGTVPSDSPLKKLLFTISGMVNINAEYQNATATAAVETTDVAYDYTVTFANGSTVLTMNAATGQTTSATVGAGNTVESLPTGATYTVTRVRQGYSAPVCFVNSAAVPADYTGALDANEVLTITYTGGNNDPEFVISRNLWVSSDLTGKTQTPANTMQEVACTDGMSGTPNGDYVLLFPYDVSEIGNAVSLVPFQIMAGNTSLYDFNGEWKSSTSHNDGYIRIYYNSETNVPYFQNNDGHAEAILAADLTTETATIIVKLDDNNDNYKTLSKVEGSDHVYELKDIDVSGTSKVGVFGRRVWDTNGYPYWNDIHGTKVDVYSMDKVDITYYLKSNCLVVNNQGMNFYRQYLTNTTSIDVATDGQVSLCVENTGSVDITRSQYSVVLTNNKTGNAITLTGGTVAANGGKACFSSATGAVSAENYDLKAELFFESMLSDTDARSFCGKDWSVQDTIYYTIDNSYTTADACELIFPSIKPAVDHLKSTSAFFASGNLVKPVVFNVVNTGTEYLGESKNSRTGGDVETNVNLFEGINNGTAPAHDFIVRNSNVANKKVSMPTLKHITIRNSRNVTLYGLRIDGYDESDGITDYKYDNAIDIDNGVDWLNNTTAGAYADANISIKSCTITAKGFTCIHVSGYGGITFEDNTINALFDTNYPRWANFCEWGAAVKFIRVANVSFLRNTFRGQHVTSMWIQDSDGVLLMNNVFWTESTKKAESTQVPALVRLLSQNSANPLPVKNIGIYYNTFYISSENVNTQTDMLRFGGDADFQNERQTHYNNVRFMYNNCYSMDTDAVSKSSDEPLWNDSSTDIFVTENNFWSENALDQTLTESSIGLAYCTSGDAAVQHHIDAPGAMCSEQANDPDDLIVRGDALNKGSQITAAQDVSGLGAQSIANDRLHTNAIRSSYAGKWTLGAYQMSGGGDIITEIIWQGTQDSNWDNRSNWVYVDAEGNFVRPNCLSAFADNLKVIIPSNSSTTYPIPEGGIPNYPEIPEQFGYESSARADEPVQAGNTGKYFTEMHMEYGAALINANLLKTAPLTGETGDAEGTVRRYESVTADYVAPRDTWALTGTVVKPFNSDGTTRNVKSGDYYLNDLPRVFMRHAEFDVTEGTVSWGSEFRSLEEEIAPDDVFAVFLPNRYGRYSYTAERYAATYGGIDPNDGTVPKTYTFNGQFAAESGMPVYSGLIDGQYELLNNYLPANLDAAMVQSEGGFDDVKYYVASGDGGWGSFVSYNSSEGDGTIWPKNGFLVKKTSGSGTYDFTITEAMVKDGTTQIYRTRSMSETLPYVNVLVKNRGTNWGSQVRVSVNHNVNEYNASAFAIDKLFNTTPDMKYVPEVYIIDSEKPREAVQVGSVEQVIPLGVVVREKMDLSFYARNIDGINGAWIEDRAVGTDLNDIVNFLYVVRNLEPGDYQGRFYLHLSMAAGEPEVPVEDQPSDDVVDDGVATDVNDNSAESIEIYNDNSVITVTAPSDVQLQTIYVTDMAGRTRAYKATGNYTVLNLDLGQGVYIVNAIGDNASAETKIVVK